MWGSGFRVQGSEFRVQGTGDLHLADKLGEDGHVPHGVVQRILALHVRLDLRERISSVYYRSERSRTFGTTRIFGMTYRSVSNLPRNPGGPRNPGAVPRILGVARAIVESLHRRPTKIVWVAYRNRMGSRQKPYEKPT